MLETRLNIYLGELIYLDGGGGGGGGGGLNIGGDLTKIKGWFVLCCVVCVCVCEGLFYIVIQTFKTFWCIVPPGTPNYIGIKYPYLV